MKIKTTTIVLIIVLFLASFIGGGAFWFYQKTKSLAASILNSSQNLSQTPTPEVAASTDIIMPKSDAAGQDLAAVSRYPGSIRSGYYVSDEKNFYAIDYIANVAPEKVVEFYKQKLSDWNLVSSSEKILVFSKGNNEATIEVTISDPNSNLTSYSITYLIVAE